MDYERGFRQIKIYLKVIYPNLNFIKFKGNQWYQGIAPYQYDMAHQLFIQGTRGKNFESSIVSNSQKKNYFRFNIYFDLQAIDDLLITRGNCVIAPTLALPQLLSEELIKCDFERDYCNWINETKNTKFNWALDNAGRLKLSSF